MKPLGKRLLFNLSYFGLWMGYFALSRIWFLLYYTDQTGKLDWKTIFQIPIQGLKLDLSFSGYMAAIPFLIIAFSIWMPENITRKTIKYFTFPMLFLVNFLMVFDLALYGPWGIRLDSTTLIYLNTPKEMFASVTAGELILGILFWSIGSLLYAYLFNRVINSKSKGLAKGKLLHFPALLLFAAILILPIRGGLQTIPINQSNVYFSNQMFANHASVNFAWNFMKSVGYKTYEMENPFMEMTASKADSLFNQAKQYLTATKSDTTRYNILKTTRPNVILIIWESLTAKFVGPLGGEPNVTENFNRLTKEGVLFNNFYANGDRSDKGIISILSGYPPQPHKSIIKMPNKSRTLPMLPQKMADLGYSGSFYHGGDLNFGNMNTYLRNSGIKHFVDGDDFDSDDWNSKWGVHDHILMERYMSDISGERPEPFFDIVYTLSSHEPFEFPGAYKFGKNNPTNKFRSSHAYTDKVIGDFIEQAKKQAWWDNTLVVILADHGHPLPKLGGPFNGPSKFKIPMLWLGGALNRTNIRVSNIGAQTDFAYSLLNLLEGDTTDFEWGMDIFKDSPDHFAHYIFNKGFGTLTHDGLVVYDYVSNKAIISTGRSEAKLEKLGKAITQKAYQDFLERK